MARGFKSLRYFTVESNIFAGLIAVFWIVFMQRLEVGNIPEDIVNTYYKDDAPHDMYIGEVIDIIR